MKKMALLFLAVVSAAVLRAQDSLHIRLDSLLQEPALQTSQVGVVVFDLRADTIVWQHHARQLLRPASTMKLLTAITALDHLGTGYPMRTRLYATGDISNGKLQGDIYCVGHFDPMITDLDVRQLAQRIHQLGIDTLQGNVVADRSMKEAVDYGEGWCWDDKNPLLTPLSVGRKNTFVGQLIDEMRQEGITLVDTQPAEGKCPETAALLALCEHTIGQMLPHMMKTSDNFYAESMFYQAGKSLASQRPVTANDARTVVRHVIDKAAGAQAVYRIADGSGLSLYNYVSAELEVMMLRYAWHDERIFTPLYDALPIAGVDGTLKKRMRGTEAAGNVHAKTGTLFGVSSLAGYLTTADGRPLAFAIINQGVMQGKTGRDFQDKVCKLLCE